VIEYLHIVEKETTLFIKNVCFDCSKVCWWNPNLLCHHLVVDKTALNVTDDDQDKHNKQPLKLTLYLHWLLKVRDEIAQSADS